MAHFSCAHYVAMWPWLLNFNLGVMSLDATCTVIQSQVWSGSTYHSITVWTAAICCWLDAKKLSLTSYIESWVSEWVEFNAPPTEYRSFQRLVHPESLIHLLFSSGWQQHKYPPRLALLLFTMALKRDQVRYQPAIIGMQLKLEGGSFNFVTLAPKHEGK